jgi:putative glutathione S-transferase
VNHAERLKELYHKSDPTYKGRVSVPVLWDKKTSQIVNNESSEIIRMLNSEFNAIAKNPKLDLYPEAVRQKIDDVNSWVYDDINNGVYKSGFAGTQEACMLCFISSATPKELTWFQMTAQ